jgi:hypothetical protein
MRTLALAAVLVLSLPACRREEPPDAVWRRLSAAVRARDADTAWSLLSGDTRRWLDARAAAAAAAAPGVVPASGRDLLLGAAAVATRPPRSIVLVRESQERAVLLVGTEPGEGVEVTLVNEGGWKLDLPEPRRDPG